MSRKGKPCSVCANPRVAEIDATKGSYTTVAPRFGIAPTTLQRHRIHRREEAEAAARKAAAPPSVPPPPTTERELLLTAAARVQASLAKAETEELPRLLAAVNAITKRLQALDEVREVTEEEIVRSKAWRSILARLEAALRPYPEAARAMLLSLGAA